MGVLLFSDPHKTGQLMIFSKAKVHLFSTCHCNIHLQAPGAAVPHSHPRWAKLSANLCWIPASQVGNWFLKCICNWEVKAAVFTHTSSCWMPRNCFWNEKKTPWHNYSSRRFPRRWGRGIDLAEGGENLQLLWSEWDRLSAARTADDGVIKYLP